MRSPLKFTSSLSINRENSTSLINAIFVFRIEFPQIEAIEGQIRIENFQNRLDKNS